MLLLGCSALGWIPDAEVHDVGVLLIAFVFPLELLATIFAFLARDTLGATTLGLFTTSWLAFGWSDLRAAPGQTSSALGIFQFGFAAAAVLLALMSARAKPYDKLLWGLVAVVLATHSKTNVNYGYVLGAGLMIGAGIVAIFLAVPAERRSLEDVARPLTAARERARRRRDVRPMPARAR